MQLYSQEFREIKVCHVHKAGPLQYASQCGISYFKCCSPVPFWCVHFISYSHPQLYQFSLSQLLHKGKAETTHLDPHLHGLCLTECNRANPTKLKHNKAPIASLTASSKPREMTEKCSKCWWLPALAVWAQQGCSHTGTHLIGCYSSHSDILPGINFAWKLFKQITATLHLCSSMLLTKTSPLIPPDFWWFIHSLLEGRDSVSIHFSRLWVKLFPDQICPKWKRFITHMGRQKQTSLWRGLIYSPGWCRQQEALQYYQTLSLVPREGTRCADFIEHGNAPRRVFRGK